MAWWNAIFCEKCKFLKTHGIYRRSNKRSGSYSKPAEGQNRASSICTCYFVPFDFWKCSRASQLDATPSVHIRCEFMSLAIDTPISISITGAILWWESYEGRSFAPTYIFASFFFLPCSCARWWGAIPYGGMPWKVMSSTTNIPIFASIARTVR